MLEMIAGDHPRCWRRRYSLEASRLEFLVQGRMQAGWRSPASLTLGPGYALGHLFADDGLFDVE